MNLWGATPLLVMAFLNGSAGTSLPSVHAIVSRAATEAVASQAPTLPDPGPTPSTGLQAPSPTASASPSLATPTAVLTQDKSGRFWTTTVLLDAADPNCPGPPGDYWLETSSAGPAIPAASARRVNQPGLPGSAAASPCKVDVTFTRISPIPANAALVFDEAGTLSSTQLTLSRFVGESDYITIPVIAALAMALLLLGMVFWLVEIRDYKGERMDFWDGRYWTYSTTPSGALKVGIISVVTILATFLGAAAVAGSIFPGVALGPFAVAGILAGLISAISTGVSGVLYANWRHWNPGITAGARLRPLLRVRLSADNAELHKGGRFTPEGAKSKKLRTAAAVSLPDVTEVMLTDDDPVVVDAGTAATLAADMWTTLEAGTRYTKITVERGEREKSSTTRSHTIPVLLDAGTVVELVAQTEVRMLVDSIAGLPNAPTVKLKKATKASLPDGTSVTLPANSRTRLPVTATVTFSPATRLSLGDRRQAEFPREASAKLTAAIRDTSPGTTITVAAGDEATLGENATTEVDAVRYGSQEEESVPTLTVPSGAEIRVPGSATVDEYGPDPKPDGQQPIQVPIGCTVKVPPRSYIKILAAQAIEVPGGSDLLIRGHSVFEIEKKDSVLTITGSDGVPDLQEHNPAGNSAARSDLTLELPVRVIAHTDAKITVTGAANVSIPCAMSISRPQGKDSPLRPPRTIELPQSSSTVLSAPLYLVIIPTLITILGIGAAIGLVGVLAIRLSDASTGGRFIAFLVLVAVVISTLYYSTTAIRSATEP